MKNKYLAPRQRVVELNEFEMLCTSKTVMKVGMKDYDTYTDDSTPRSEDVVDWDGVGTGSDF